MSPVRSQNAEQLITYGEFLPAGSAIEAEVLRYLNAKPFAKAIPNWAKWTQQQLLDWWNANLADSIVDGFAIPVAVKTMLKAQNAALLRIAQMEIAIRDHIWADLPE